MPPFITMHGIQVYAVFNPNEIVELYWDDACDRHIASFGSEPEARVYVEDFLDALNAAGQLAPADAA